MGNKLTVEQAKTEANRLLEQHGKRVRVGEFYAEDGSGFYPLYYFKQAGTCKKLILVASVYYPNDNPTVITWIMQATVGKRHFLMPNNSPSRGLKTILAGNYEIA